MKRKYNDILKSIFESRIEDIAGLTVEERESLNKRKKIILDEYVTDLTEKQKKQINSYIDVIMQDVFDESYSLNEKYYKYGFSDGVNALLTSLNMREEVERRFHNAK